MVWKLGFVPWLAIPLAMIIVGGMWNLWNVLDWQNDLYILTTDRIIDLEKVPLISEDRREARLQQIQDVHYVMPGFINRLLDFGDVEVETAGRGGGFTFRSVPHPRQVQAEIFARVDQVRKAAAALDSQRQEGDCFRCSTGITRQDRRPPLPAKGSIYQQGAQCKGPERSGFEQRGQLLRPFRKYRLQILQNEKETR